MKKVTILQDRLVHYRVGLFEYLKALAAERDIELYLVHGQASILDQKKKDEGYLDWPIKVENRYWVVGGRDLLWQPMPKQLCDSDLIIMLQHNRILSNYKIIFGTQRKRSKIAFWGHGKNFQGKNPAGFGELIKSRLVRSVDWWFTYTDVSVKVLEEAGFESSRITCLNNAIDTKSFQTDMAAVTDLEIREVREHYRIPENGLTGLFCGSIYADKKPDAMIAAGEMIKAQIPEFHFVIIGDGPDAGPIKEAAGKYEWFHYAGVKTGREKASFFKLADILINPGAVGLHVLDAFAAGIPMVTMRNSMHGPEISYLVDGYNGILTANDPAAYAQAVIKLFKEKDEYQKICQQALMDAGKYTVTQMAINFINGIEKCLKTDQ